MMENQNETLIEYWTNGTSNANKTTSVSPWMIEGWSRKLGGGGEDLVIDYTILSMAIFTLTILMLVEAGRHKLASIADKTVFFRNVLETVYRELSILGIVEACIFIIHHYWALNLTRERAFADVHFTFFFVAIFNAVQSAMLYLLSLRVAKRQWDDMEAIDINNYVLIRKQFEEVDDSLRTIEEDLSHRFGSRVEHHDRSRFSMYDTIRRKWWQNCVFNCVELLGYSSLKRRHRRLLVQVRFHELRVHFIELNQLHPKFKVAEYLKLSLNDVFHRLIHISSLSWLSLIFFSNLILFSLNLVASEEMNMDGEVNATVLSYIYLTYGFVSIFASIIISNKIKHIFYRIMRDETWITREGEKDNISSESIRSSKMYDQNYVHQLHYFWGGDPRLIVSAAQFMQFGYAIPFAILLVFNNTVFVNEDALVVWYWCYIIVPFICYTCFLYLWSHIIPQYTQCTSLGELVKKEHLIKIEARLKVNTAKRKREEEIDYIKAENEKSGLKEGLPPTAALVARLDKNNPFRKSYGDGDFDSLASKKSGSERLVKISKFVKQATKDLPDTDYNLIGDRRGRGSRKGLVRSMSDGVSSMRFFNSTSSAAKEVLQIDSLEEDKVEVSGVSILPATQPKRQKRKSASTGVELMKIRKDQTKVENDEIATIRKGQKTSTKDSDLAVLAESIPVSSGVMEKGGTKMNTPSCKDTFVTFVDERGNHPNEEFRFAPHTVALSSKDCDDGSSQGVPDIVCSKLDEKEMKEEADSFKERLQSIYLSSIYRWITVVLTLSAFLILPYRMVLILFDTCKIPDNQNIWYISTPTALFWINFILLCIFIIESFIMCIIFAKKMPGMFFAGTFDLVLAGICILLLIKAEWARCCNCTESSIVSDTYHVRSLAQEGTDVCENIVECCPQFGTRLCGGIGNIEPWISLIVLRAARFFLGKQICKIYHRCIKAKESTENDPNPNISVENHFIESDNSTQDNNIEAISEAWITAIAANPDIVEKHGVFSNAILEVMLGIKPLDQEPMSKKYVMEQEKDEHKETSVGFHPNAQSFINAGKTRLPTSTIHSRTFSNSIRQSFHIGGLGEVNHSNDEAEEFNHPASTLIRSMRRCQCQLLPWLHKWTTVDLVLTEHEIVWFDASNSSALQDNEVVERVKEAVRSTNGGKGLRLCDVAIGRTVFGHMSLNDIDIVKVQKINGVQGDGRGYDENSDEENVEVADLSKNEYWESNDAVLDSDTLLLHQEIEWKRITEHRLKIHSTQGITFLARFFVDFRRDQQASSTLKTATVGQGALIWCQSISHLCGKTQLKQKLPHFGKDEEIRDFIEVLER